MRKFFDFWNGYRITIFWAVITLIFLGLIIYSATQFKTVSKIETKIGVAKIYDIPVITGQDKFASEINNFIDDFNKINKANNNVKNIGYSATTITAFISFMGSLFQSIKKNKNNKKANEVSDGIM